MVKTPCIGICSTGIGDSVCRGCKRFAHEVIHWNSYTDEQRQLIVSRIDQFMQQIVANKIEIYDAEKLFAQLTYQQIKIDDQLSPARWLYELLRAGAAQIQSTENYGFRVKEDWQRFSLDQIKQFLDQDIYTLSCAHYERYIEPSQDR